MMDINAPGFRLLPLGEEHIDRIIVLMNKEGWFYYDHRELKRYLTLDQAAFTLLKDERVVGCIFTTNYDAQVWIGNILVDEEFRGIGLASKMIRGLIEYFKDISTFRLGSVPLAIALYKKIGFRPESFTTSQAAELPLVLKEEVSLEGSLKVEPMLVSDLDDVSEIDAVYFGSDRSEFLENLYNDSIPESCLCLKDEGQVVGFIMARRRETSKCEGGFAEGPEEVYRVGPSSILPKYGIAGFKALFMWAIKPINEAQRGNAKIYISFPRNAFREEIYADTRELAQALDMDDKLELDKVFDEHDHIFNTHAFVKNDEEWKFLERLGFRQEYFEQIMSYTSGDIKKASETASDPEGIFASATPGDKG